jgi:hypothetical protein
MKQYTRLIFNVNKHLVIKKDMYYTFSFLYYIKMKSIKRDYYG